MLRLCFFVSAYANRYASEREEWRKERAQLTSQLEAAAAKSAARSHVASGGALSDLDLSREELSHLEREIREQEAILAGYGKENEKLANELKQANIIALLCY